MQHVGYYPSSCSGMGLLSNSVQVTSLSFGFLFCKLNSLDDIISQFYQSTLILKLMVYSLLKA